MTVRKAGQTLDDMWASGLTALIEFGETDAGRPAVRVDLRSYIEPDPVYTDPTLLRRMGAEFLQAATYIERQAKKS